MSSADDARVQRPGHLAAKTAIKLHFNGHTVSCEESPPVARRGESGLDELFHLAGAENAAGAVHQLETIRSGSGLAVGLSELQFYV
jgi:hypothetical protein